MPMPLFSTNSNVVVEEEFPGLYLRLKQAICLFFYVWAMLGWPFCSWFLVVIVPFEPRTWPFALLYAAWLLLFDWNTPVRGARPWSWLRGMFAWKVLADYFPLKVVKTAELEPERNYIFAAHPHGVLATSAALMFGSDATEFGKLFPGIKVNVATLPVNFWFPFRREFLLSLGIISTDAESLAYVLGRSEKRGGNAIAIVPGGIAEMLDATPGEHRVKLANRKGFIKLALNCGADLVPVYNFGEDQIFVNFPNPEGGIIWRYQQFVRGLPFPLKNFCIPFAYGRSCFDLVLPEQCKQRLPQFLRYGFLPFRQKLTSIVGSPIKVEKCSNPTKEQIDKLHAEYCSRLMALFERYKHEFGAIQEETVLQFI